MRQDSLAERLRSYQDEYMSNFRTIDELTKMKLEAERERQMIIMRGRSSGKTIASLAGQSNASGRGIWEQIQDKNKQPYTSYRIDEMDYSMFTKKMSKKDYIRDYCIQKPLYLSDTAIDELLSLLVNNDYDIYDISSVTATTDYVKVLVRFKSSMTPFGPHSTQTLHVALGSRILNCEGSINLDTRCGGCNTCKKNGYGQ